DARCEMRDAREEYLPLARARIETQRGLNALRPVLAGTEHGGSGLPLTPTPDVEASMPNVLVVAVILLCAPLAALAQTSTNLNPGPHSTLGTEATTVTGNVSDQIKTKLESLGYNQVKDIVS